MPTYVEVIKQRTEEVWKTVLADAKQCNTYIDDDWYDFEGFTDDVGYAPHPEASLGLISADGGWVRNNCRWEIPYSATALARAGSSLMHFENRWMTVAEFTDIATECYGRLITPQMINYHHKTRRRTPEQIIEFFTRKRKEEGR